MAETPWTCIRRGGRHVLYMRSMRRLPTGTSRVRRRPTSGAEDPARSINGAKSPCYQWWSTLEANLLIREALRVICRDRSWEVLVLYRERSGGKSLENGEIVRPERFRYSDLKEAVWERSSYGFCMSTSMGTAGRKEN